MAGDITPPTESKSSGGILAEWKHASTGTKVFIVAAIGAVVVVLWYLNSQNSSSATTANAGTVAPAGTGITPMNGVTTSGGGNGTTTTTSTASGTGTSTPQLQWPGPNFSNLPWGSKFQIDNTSYQLGAGGGGKLWGVPVTGNQTLTQSQFNAVPIGSGQKTLLVAPSGAQSVFHP